MSKIFAESLPRIAATLAKHSKPFLATLSRGGDIHVVYPRP